jgi:hypothetical protein
LIGRFEQVAELAGEAGASIVDEAQRLRSFATSVRELLGTENEQMRRRQR